MSPAKEKNPPNKRRVFLFTLFLVPSALCLTFYYFGIRKPFTEGGKVFKSLPHYGRFVGLNTAGDSIFESVTDFQMLDLRQETVNQASLNNKFYLLSFVDDSCSEDCKAVLFQLSRAQEKLHYLRKGFQIVTIVNGDSVRGMQHLDRMEKAVHPDSEIWKMGIARSDIRPLVFDNLRINMLPRLARCKHAIPSEWAVLVDREHKTRAYYRIIDVKETDRFITEALVLSAEYGKFKNMNLNKN